MQIVFREGVMPLCLYRLTISKVLEYIDALLKAVLKEMGSVEAGRKGQKKEKVGL